MRILKLENFVNILNGYDLIISTAITIILQNIKKLFYSLILLKVFEVIILIFLFLNLISPLDLNSDNVRITFELVMFESCDNSERFKGISM